MAVAGHFPEVSFSELLQFYCLSKKTVAIRVSTPDLPEGRGEFFVADGELLDARFGERVGVDAFYRALDIRRGSFEVEVDVRPPARRIHVPLNEVLQQGMNGASEASARPSEAVTRSDALPIVEPPAGRLCPECGTWHAEDAYCPGPATQPGQAGPALEALAPSPEPPDLGDVEAGALPEPSRKLAGVAILGGFLLLGIVALFLLFSLRPRVATVPEAPPPAAARPAAPEAAPAATPSAAPATAQPAAPGVQGVTADSIVVGLAAPFSGPSKELGRQMKVGLEAAFAQANEAGGVHGRRLTLVPEDDGADPSRIPGALRVLWDKRKVFALVGNVGASNALASVPFVLERRSLLFGALSGAQVLRRDPPDRYVFNLRASDAEETAAIVRFLLRRGIRPESIAVFGEEGAASEAGYQGVAKLLRRERKLPTVLRVGYARNTLDIEDAVQRIRTRAPWTRAVVMIGSYRASARFIARMRAVMPGVTFASVSSVGATAFADELQQLGAGTGDGVIVTQVVPPVDSGATAVLTYKKQLEKLAPDEKPDAVSFEGYLVGRLLVEALQRAGRDLDSEKLVDALESLRDLDLGTGTKLAFGPSEHQASHRVWGTLLDGRGRYQVFDLE
ncbi:MAG TPA: ABC transporter substrate-binding protein [Myxococcaceae bacterium]|nr:ABC transporter substrate-binding protein [Myxococcaceae bacterium]